MQPYRKILLANPPRLEPVRGQGLLNVLFGGTEYVISRRLCSFWCRKLQSPQIKRDVLRALVLEAEVKASGNKSGVHIGIDGDNADVWTWDSELLSLLPTAANCRAVPETMLHAPADGFVLRACLEGVEGQYWAGERLLASRWWNSVPQEPDWIRFCRSVGVTETIAGIGVPEVTPGIDWSRTAKRNRAPLDYIAGQLSWTHAAVMAALVAALPVGYLGVKNAALSIEASGYEREQAILSEVTRERRSISREIDALARQLAPFEASVSEDDPLTALAPLLEVLNSYEFSLSRFSLQEDDLELSFTTDQVFSEPELVAALEQIAALGGVILETEGRSGGWMLRAKLEGTDNG